MHAAVVAEEVDRLELGPVLVPHLRRVPDPRPSNGPCPEARSQVNRDLDMWSTCTYALRMSVMIQIRNVPEALHRKLKARAALAGQSLSDFLLDELRRGADRPTRAEILERIATREPVRARPAAAAAVRSQRESR